MNRKWIKRKDGWLNFDFAQRIEIEETHEGSFYITVIMDDGDSFDLFGIEYPSREAGNQALDQFMQGFID